MSNELKGYGLLDLETGEKKFIFLTEKQYAEAYNAEEIQNFVRYMEKHEMMDQN